MDVRQWLITIALASFTLVWSLIMKLIPLGKLCPKVNYTELQYLKYLGWKEND